MSVKGEVQLLRMKSTTNEHIKAGRERSKHVRVCCTAWHGGRTQHSLPHWEH